MGPNADPFMFHIYAATLAKQERRMISNRTKDAVKAKQPQGKRTALRPDPLRGGILERTEFGHSGDSTLSCQDSNSRTPFTRDPVPFPDSQNRD
jgi:DNA invertase Pin-like site-specific DNA recombinase